MQLRQAAGGEGQAAIARPPGAAQAVASHQGKG